MFWCEVPLGEVGPSPLVLVPQSGLSPGTAADYWVQLLECERDFGGQTLTAGVICASASKPPVMRSGQA